MSEFDRQSGSGEEYHIPVLLLPNTRDILNGFGESIQRISASGSRMSKDTIEKNENYGFQVDNNFSSSVSLDYNRHRNTDGEITNPLTQERINNINNKIHQSLSSAKPQESGDITHDIPITRLIVEVDSKILRVKYDTHKNELFYFDFQLENTENLGGDFKEMIKPLFEERNLPEQGFNWRVPVLRQIIPNQGFDFGGNNHNPAFSWDPQNTNTMPLKITTSQEVAGMLPDKLGYNKGVEMMNNDYWAI